MESNHPSVGLPRPAGFEDQLGGDGDLTDLPGIPSDMRFRAMARAMVFPGGPLRLAVRYSAAC